MGFWVLNNLSGRGLGVEVAGLSAPILAEILGLGCLQRPGAGWAQRFWG